MVMEKQIPFYSMCAHHLVPFYGHAHIAYIPRDRILGLSKFARILEFYAKRPQLQERLTEQVVTYLEEKLQPLGAMVVIEARHLCVEMRGVKKPGALTVTSALRGIFHQKPVREEFLDLLRRMLTGSTEMHERSPGVLLPLLLLSLLAAGCGGGGAAVAVARPS